MSFYPPGLQAFVHDLMLKSKRSPKRHLKILAGA